MKKGFTLLELLVVVAILGILSAVVMTSLSSAKNKGNDASTKAQLSKIRDWAEQYYQNNNNYSTFCSSATIGLPSTDIPSLLAKSSGAASFVSTLGTPGTATTIICHESPNGWALAAPLKSEAGYWCVDVLGFSGKRTNPLAASALACPSS